jgi:hypothetical protein
MTQQIITTLLLLRFFVIFFFCLQAQLICRGRHEKDYGEKCSTDSFIFQTKYSEKEQ